MGEDDATAGAHLHVEGRGAHGLLGGHLWCRRRVAPRVRARARDGRRRQYRDAQRGGGGGGGAEGGGERGLHRCEVGGGGEGGGHGDGGGDEHAGGGHTDRDERRVDTGGGGDVLLQGRGVRIVTDAAAGRQREHNCLLLLLGSLAPLAPPARSSADGG
eukprot:scaffold36000_cov60-Phaeocystis_antarctica.AAC.5